MSHSVISRIAARTGATPVDKTHTLGDIRQVSFDVDTEYEAICKAAAKIDAETDTDVMVWGCGVSIDGCPRVAIQRFESTDPSDADRNEDNREYSNLRSDETAGRGPVTAQRGQSYNTTVER
ncbi:MAG: hypothetical protein J07HN4v3_02123 [Halonotius sp. J07HN4]|nr:MAG: hypothetical protein J07HN4v3_02123 [Halonotius sp. J07HN4]